MNMFPSSLLLSPHNCSRPVDARWQRIVDLADTKQPAKGAHDDDWIRRGVHYLRRLRRCMTSREHRRLARKLPDLAFAHQLHLNPDRMTRAVPEARLLAGQSIEEVAAACNMPVAGLVAYEAVFYQVTGRLRHFAFILINALGKNIWNGSLTMNDRDVVLKHLAFIAGPVFLDIVLPYFLHGLQLPDSFENCTRADLVALSRRIDGHSLMLSAVLPFPACMRSLRFMNLSRELNKYLETLDALTRDGLITEDAVRIPSLMNGSKLVTPATEDSWLAVWREAAMAA